MVNWLVVATIAAPIIAVFFYRPGPRDDLRAAPSCWRTLAMSPALLSLGLKALSPSTTTR